MSGMSAAPQPAKPVVPVRMTAAGASDEAEAHCRVPPSGQAQGVHGAPEITSL